MRLPLKLPFFLILTLFFLTQPILSSNPHYLDRFLLSSLTPSQEILVNTWTADAQTYPVVTTLTDGKILVAWHSLNQDGSSNGVYAQRFNADGTRSGIEFKVNTQTAGSQKNPAVAALPDGKFIVVWQQDSGSGVSHGIYGQMYNSDGTEKGGEFKVSTTTTGAEIRPKVATDGDGSFIIAWENTGVYIQMYNTDGTKRGSELTILNSYFNINGYPSITILKDNGFVIFYTTHGQDGSSYGVYAQRYNADGTLYGSEFRVNTFYQGIQEKALGIPMSDGGFLAVWSSETSTASTDFEIHARRYNSDSSPNGGEYLVNTYTLERQRYPSISVLGDGGFLVVWNSRGQDGDGQGVYGQRYNADLTLYGGEFRVDDYILGDQMLPSVTSYADRGFVVVWQSAGQDGSDNGVYAKLYLPPCPADKPKLYEQYCYADCPLLAPNLYDNICYSSCPSMAPYLYSQNCYVMCPDIAPNMQNNECFPVTSQTAAINGQNKATEIALKAASAANSNNPSYILLAGLSSMFLNIKYLRINYPSKVRAMFLAQGSQLISVSFDISLPENIENNLPDRPLPEVFEQYDVPSSFLVNFWSPLISFLAILALTLVMIFLESRTKTCSRTHTVFRKLSDVAKWNLPLLLICGNFSDIIFYISLEFRTAHFESAGPTLSFLIGLVMLTIALLVLIKAVIVLNSIRKSEAAITAKRNWESYSIFFEEYGKNSYLSLGYLPIFFFRNSVFSLVITNAFDYPLPQSIVFIVLSVLMLTYLAWIRPFKSRLQLVQQFLNETLLITLNICVLILAILDAQGGGENSTDDRDNIGEVIIVLNMIFSTLNMVFTGLELAKLVIELYRKIKAAREKGLTFSQILKSIFVSEESDIAQYKTKRRRSVPVITINEPKENIDVSSMNISELQQTPQVKVDQNSTIDLNISRNSENLELRPNEIETANNKPVIIFTKHFCESDSQIKVQKSNAVIAKDQVKHSSEQSKQDNSALMELENSLVFCLDETVAKSSLVEKEVIEEIDAIFESRPKKRKLSKDNYLS